MKKTKIGLKDIADAHPEMDYLQLYEYIMQMVDNGELLPVKRAKTNGRKPALPLSFWKIREEQDDYAEVYEELDYRMNPQLHTEYYRKNPQAYLKDRDKILLLSNYLDCHSELLKIPETMNERSFEIFHREKFFQEEGGLNFCKRLGISREMLGFYETSEPLSYYSRSKKTPQNILIIENKDTFYDIRRYISQTGSILGKEFDTVIYGAGKGIWSTFADYVNQAEEYFGADNRLYYFGDLDYEGILIYEHLVKGNQIQIALFKTAYEKMIEKAQSAGIENLPDTKQGQNTGIENVFMDSFCEKTQSEIWNILKSGKYIPQEILNEHDWG